MKSFLILFVLLFFVTCGPTDDKKDQPSGDQPTTSQPSPDTPAPTVPPVTPQPDPDGTPPIVDTPVEPTVPTPAQPPVTSEVPPDRADTLDFNIVFDGKSSYDTAARKKKYQDAIPRCKRIVSSKEFKDRILYHKKRNGTYGFTFSSSDPCKSNSCVYEHILDANEKLQNTKDNEIDMGVRFYYSSGNVIGWTNGSIKYINVNIKYFDKYTDVSICANLMHEYMHKLYYNHASSHNADRPYSVPYGVGTAVTETGKKVK